MGAVARIRDELSYATMRFFHKLGFRYVNTPNITTSDCEGAGEMFQVTTLISEAEKLEKNLIKNPPPSEVDVESAKLIIKQRGNDVAQLKSVNASKQEIGAAVAELQKAKENILKMEERSKLQPRNS